MLTRASRDLRVSFYLTEDALLKIASILEDNVGKVEIEAKCSDSAERSFTSSDELLAFDNISEQRIRSLRLSARSEKTDLKTSIEFHSERAIFSLQDRGIIVIRSIGRDADCVHLQKALEIKTKAICPRYFEMSMVGINHLMMIFCAVPLAFVFSLVLFQVISGDGIIWEDLGFQNLDVGSIVLNLLFGALLGVFTLAICVALVRMRQAIAPSGVFLFGQQKQVEKTRASVRKWLTRTFMGGLLLFALREAIF